MTKGRWISGLDDFGLSKAELRNLGGTPVTVEVTIHIPPYTYPSSLQFRTLIRKSPTERRELVHQWRVRAHEKLRKEIPVENLAAISFNNDPVGFRFIIAAKEVGKLFSLRHAESIRIKAIKGIRCKARREHDSRYYAVKARFAIQVEEQTTGMQTYEDRILLVNASSEKEAKKLAMREFREYETPTLSTTGHFYRWGFEKILDIYETFDTAIDANGTEVYSELKDRRMKPEYEWHPEKRPAT